MIYIDIFFKRGASYLKYINYITNVCIKAIVLKGRKTKTALQVVILLRSLPLNNILNKVP